MIVLIVNFRSTGRGERRLEKDFVFASAFSSCIEGVTSAGVGGCFDFFLTRSDRVIKLLITDLVRLDFWVLLGLWSACDGEEVGVNKASWLDGICERPFTDLEGSDEVDFTTERLLFIEDRLISLPILWASKLVECLFARFGDSPPSEDPEWAIFVTEPAARNPPYDENLSLCIGEVLSKSFARLVLKTNLGDARPCVEQSSAIWRGLSSMSNSLSTRRRRRQKSDDSYITANILISIW